MFDAVLEVIDKVECLMWGIVSRHMSPPQLLEQNLPMISWAGGIGYKAPDNIRIGPQNGKTEMTLVTIIK